MTLVNIDSTDIVDCKLKLILGLIWTLILHYAISMPMWEGPPLGGGDPVAQKTPKEKLRDWIQNKVPDLPVGNLTKDFQGPYSIEMILDFSFWPPCTKAVHFNFELKREYFLSVQTTK